MKRVLILLLLAFVMCQCNNQSGQQNQSAQKSSSEQDSEKFSKDYIGRRTLELGVKLCDCDPSKANAFFHNSQTAEETAHRIQLEVTSYLQQK